MYFSGHGMTHGKNNQLFLAVRDTQHQLLSGTAVAASFLLEEMENSNAKRQVLILDCCYSGAFVRGSKGGPGGSINAASLFRGYGRVVLTASDSVQYAWEGDQVHGQAENSVFTHYLIEGIRTGKADKDQDGEISVDELYDYAFDQVRRVSSRQTPTKVSFREQGNILIAHNPQPIPEPLPLELERAVTDTLALTRQAVVSQLEGLLRGQNKRLAVTARQKLEKLAEDDSRSVSSAAREVLERNSPGDKPPIAQTVPSSAGPPVASRPDGTRMPSSTNNPRLNHDFLLAAALEAFAGWFGFLGIGNIILGDRNGGLSKMAIWWVALLVMATLTLCSQGLALLIVGPIWFVVPIISGASLDLQKSSERLVPR
jgi:hypothetical protein